MSNLPSNGPGDEGGPAELDSPPVAALATAPSPSRDLVVPVTGPAASAEADWLGPQGLLAPQGSRELEMALFEAEARLDEVANPKRAARLLHEVARLGEQKPKGAREAARLYTASLASDPTLLPNTWALYRLFSARESWENVLRLLDAELRFSSSNTPASQKADLLVERGRLLEDRLGREEDALTAYRAAIALDPGHAGALLSLLLFGVGAGADAIIDEALFGLATRLDDPRMRARFVVERARRVHGPLNGDDVIARVRSAAEILLEALSAGPNEIDEEAIADELDWLSLLGLDADLRARVLDVFDAHFGRGDTAARHEPALVVAVHREKARLLAKRGSRDSAMAVLERGLRLSPRHPLLVADLVDLADEAARPDTIAALEEAGHLPAGLAADEANLRRAEASARNGAYGEAMGILAGLPETSPVQPLARLLRVRVMSRTGDAEGLSEAFVSEADRLLGDASESGGRNEAAHLLVRAAVLRRMSATVGEPGEPGETDDAGLLKRALSLVPGFPPAKEALRQQVQDGGDAARLAALYEEEARVESEPVRAERLLRSAYLIYRDLARNPEAARRLLAHAPPVDKLSGAVRDLDDAGERVAGQENEAATLLPAIETLLTQLPDGEGSAELALLAARLAAEAQPGAEGVARSQAFAERALARRPGSGAAALLETVKRRSGGAADVAAVLRDELDASAQGPAEINRALRFRLALAESDAGHFAAAVETLSPLRGKRDRAAVVWSLELARRSGAAEIEVALLEEPISAAVLGEGDELGPIRVALAVDHARLHAQLQAQLRGAVGEPAAAGGARSSLPSPEALAAAGPRATFARAEAALLALRLETNPSGRAAAWPEGFATLADALAGSTIAVDVRQDAALIALAAGATDAKGAVGDLGTEGPWPGLNAFVVGARRGDAALRTQGLEGLADSASQETQAELWARIALRRLLAASGEATDEAKAAAHEASLRANSAGPVPLFAIASTDLGVPGTPTHGLVEARAKRLEEAGPAALGLRVALLAEGATAAEAAMDWGLAANGWARVLDLEPGSLEAVLGLRRAARASGHRPGEAAALLRLGALSRDPRRAATTVAEAGRLFADEGLDEAAAAAFTQVLRLSPDDDAAYQRLHDITVDRKDPVALDRLLTWKLAHAPDDRARLPLYAERAALRVGPLERRQDAIADYRRIAALDPDDVDCLTTLARLASEAACPEIAARFLVDALERSQRLATLSPERHARTAAAIRRDLAAAYVAGEDDDSAIETLGEAIAAEPGARDLRESLIAAATRQRQWSLVVAQFEALAAAADNAEDRAAWLVRKGRVLLDDKADREGALAAFREALTIDPLGEAARAFATALGDVPVGPDDQPLATAACQALRTSLARSPFAPRRLESLALLARANGAVDLGEIAAQLHGLLGGPASRGRTRGLIRTLALDAFAPEATPKVERVLALWPHIAGHVARLCAPDPATVGKSRATRLAPGSEPRLAWVEAAAAGLGLASLPIYVAGRDDLGVSGFDAPDPDDTCLVIGRGVAGADAKIRFQVGRTLALLAQRATVLDRMEQADLEREWAAAIFLATERLDPRWDAAALRARAKEIGKSMSRKERKAFAEAAADVMPGSLDIPAFRERAMVTANRGGLLVGGDLAMALRVVSGRAEPSPADLEASDCLDVIRFAFGDRFAALREEVRQRDRINTGDHGRR